MNKEELIESILNRQRERLKIYDIKELKRIETEMDNDEISYWGGLNGISFWSSKGIC